MLLSQTLFRLPQARVVPAPESDLQAIPDIEHHFICLLVFLLEVPAGCNSITDLATTTCVATGRLRQEQQPTLNLKPEAKS